MFDIWDVQGRAIPYTLRFAQPRQRVHPAESKAPVQDLPARSPQARQALNAYAEIRDLERPVSRPVARDWMSQPVRTLPPDASLATAQALLQRLDVRCLPVVCAKHPAPIGMLSERELLLHHWLDRASGGAQATPRATRVDEVMRTDVLCARPETTIHRIAHVMVQEHLFAMPVVDPEQGLVGLLSRGDILRLVVELTAAHLPTL